MVSKVKVSSGNQIVVPAQVRTELCIEPGDHLLVAAGDGLITIVPVEDGTGQTSHEGCIGDEPGVTSIVKVSSKNQIAVPSAIRKSFGIRPGDRLLVSVWDRCITVLPEPESYALALRGLHKEIWEGMDTEEYINQERDAWGS
ncbi:hypothetical protein BH23CHL2_BH23CHL2_21720 [soil metagenome]